MAPGTVVRWNMAYVVAGTAFATARLEPALFGLESVIALQQIAAVALAAGLLLINGPVLFSARHTTAPRRHAGATLVLLLLAVFYGYTLLSAGWSERGCLGLQKAAAFGLTSLAAVSLALQVDARRVFIAFGITLGVVAVVGLAVGLAGSPVAFMSPEEPLYSGLFANRNSAAKSAGVAATVGLALLFVAAGSVRARAAIGVLLTVAVATVAWSGSVGGWLAIVAAPLLVYLAFGRRQLLAAIIAAIVAVVIAAALWLGGTLGFAGDAVHIGGLELSTHQRSPIWAFGIGHLAERPLFGFGLMGFWTEARAEELLRLRGLPFPNMHNGFLHVLVEGGIVGLALLTALFAGFLAAVLRLLRARPHPEVILCTAYVLAFFLANLHEYYLLRGTMFLQTLFTYAVARVGHLYWQRHAYFMAERNQPAAQEREGF